jgi:hypothetical protein
MCNYSICHSSGAANGLSRRDDQFAVGKKASMDIPQSHETRKLQA